MCRQDPVTDWDGTRARRQGGSVALSRQRSVSALAVFGRSDGTEEQRGADALIGSILGNQRENFALAFGQVCEGIRITRPVDEPGDDCGVQDSLAFRNPRQGVGHNADVGHALLEQVADPFRMLLEEPHRIR